jgi:hypothetical protein
VVILNTSIAGGEVTLRTLMARERRLPSENPQNGELEEKERFVEPRLGRVLFFHGLRR